jgi:hypothetical protein
MADPFPYNGLAPYVAPASEFTTPGDLHRERIASRDPRQLAIDEERRRLDEQWDRIRRENYTFNPGLAHARGLMSWLLLPEMLQSWGSPQRRPMD